MLPLLLVRLLLISIEVAHYCCSCSASALRICASPQHQPGISAIGTPPQRILVGISVVIGVISGGSAMAVLLPERRRDCSGLA